MAHFAQIKDGIIEMIIVVNNEILIDDDGIEKESIGIDFCKTLFGQETNWVQTSYNGNFRGIYAGSASHYDEEQDLFVKIETNEIL